jgi:hypothetical protein
MIDKNTHIDYLFPGKDEKKQYRKPIKKSS